MQQTNVIVVGAGMAGLGAAYELSKHPEYKVTVLEERERVGGRVHTISVNGHPVDFGGFLIYRWYKHYHRVVNELNLNHLLERVQIKDIYYQLDNSGDYVFGKDLQLPKADQLKLTVALAKGVLMSYDPANPPLDAFDHLTAQEYFRKVLKRPNHAGSFETVNDVFMQGFCYPGFKEIKLSFLAPFLFSGQFYGGIDQQSYIRSGNHQVPAAMAKFIEAAGNQIVYGAKVTKVDDHTVHTTAGEFTADKLVFAQNATPELFASILPNVQVQCGYTHFYTATLKVNKPPVVSGDQGWGSVFYLPNKEKYQVTSSVNLGVVYHPDLSNYINLNVVVRNATNEAPLSKTELFKLLETELHTIFPDVQAEEFVELVHWSKTMPIAQEAFVAALRVAQGEHGYYFAGDYFGAPSMETALRTGVRAAQAVML